MSTLSGGPNIVTNGLVLSLDAANPKSYISGSTTWNDISRGGNNGTLINGPTFNSGNYGSIVFDGTNDFISLTTSYSLTKNYTLRFIFKTNTVSATTAYFQMLNSLSPTAQNSMKLEWNNRFIAYNNSGTLQSYAFAFPLSPPFNLVGTFNDMHVTVNDSGILTIYNNGVACTPTSSTSGTLDFQVLGRSQGTFLPESISVFQLYNRSLSAAEVIQNFNSTRSRFGL